MGEVREVLPGLLWVRMDLPFPPKNVNLWLLEDGEGWLAIDSGVQEDHCRAAWERIFETALAGKPITRVLVTHFHLDHVGLAGWLCEKWNAPLLMTRTEFLQSRLFLLDDDGALLEQFRAVTREAGAPGEYDRHLDERGQIYRPSVAPLPTRFTRIAAGDRLTIGGREWEVIVGRGHAPAMATLYCAELKLLIAADQILPRISPYIGVSVAEPDGDPLGEFLAANEQYRRLPEDTYVLPSHGEPFTGLHARIDALAEHHAERLSMLEEACKGEGLTAFGAALVLFPHVKAVSQMGFMVGESLAHLNRLVTLGRVMRLPGEDGLPRYRTLS
ncbi:MBL fold metallo-hydrolase [Acetobacteraceae bacterium H6797]|nr:MBL fold metallo-hydrolase [Acetobacteraceae bacterium H6797]